MKWGLFTGFVNGCLQMLLGFWAPPTPTFLYFLGEVLLDYLVAFMALGTAELFARRRIPACMLLAHGEDRLLVRKRQVVDQLIAE